MNCNNVHRIMHLSRIIEDRNHTETEIIAAWGLRLEFIIEV